MLLPHKVAEKLNDLLLNNLLGVTLSKLWLIGNNRDYKQKTIKDSYITITTVEAFTDKYSYGINLWGGNRLGTA